MVSFRRHLRSFGAAAAAAVLTLLTLPVPGAGAATSSNQWARRYESPAPFGARTAYDAATGQLVTLGFQNTPVNGSTQLTWTWDGQSWASHSTPVQPDSSAAMAYDEQTRQLLVFGGWDKTADTANSWSWNGGQWQQLSPSEHPTARDSAGIAFDPASNRILLFGGESALGQSATALNDTWAWDGTTWAKLSPTHQPPAQAVVGIVGDPAIGKTVLFLTGSTWEWNGIDWTQVDAPGLPKADAGGNTYSGPLVTYDAALGSIVGMLWAAQPTAGSPYADSFWAFDGTQWSALTSVPDAAVGLAPASFAYDSATHELIAYGGNNCAESQCFPPNSSAIALILAQQPNGSVPRTRLAGADRDATAVAVSAQQYPTAGSASAVVLARADDYADALAGGPLAAAKGGPLLLTSTATLDQVTADEISRVLKPGGAVYLLGGTAALSDAVASAVSALGMTVTRLAGTDRAQTAVAVADALGDPATVFEASRQDYPDALSAVPAAIKEDAAILLTDGGTQDPATAAYLSAHAGVHYAVGGPAEAADPAAIDLAGSDRYVTSEAVALAFFPDADQVALASGQSFADALAGAPYAASKSAPVLLVPPTGTLAASAAAYLATHPLNGLTVFGGTAALSDDSVNQATQAAANGVTASSPSP